MLSKLQVLMILDNIFKEKTSTILMCSSWLLSTFSQWITQSDSVIFNQNVLKGKTIWNLKIKSL